MRTRTTAKPLSGPNDVTIDGKGRLYFTDSSGAAVYRIDAPGKVARILAAPDIQRPNGIQISPDDRTLYIVEANGAEGGARMIRAYDLLPDGTVRNMRVLYNFYPGRSADGMSVDTQGNLYAAAGMHRTRGTAETLDTKCGVYVISPAGEAAEVHSRAGGLHHQHRVRRSGHEDAVHHGRQDALQGPQRHRRSAALTAVSFADRYRAMETLSSLHRSPSPAAVKLMELNGASETIPKKLL